MKIKACVCIIDLDSLDADTQFQSGQMNMFCGIRLALIIVVCVLRMNAFMAGFVWREGEKESQSKNERL